MGATDAGEKIDSPPLCDSRKKSEVTMAETPDILYDNIYFSYESAGR